ncbi:hypothetical protein Tco_0888556 [Tanacetum coccineum]
MDRLSKRKFGIVCHGKVVRIPLEGDEILQVHSERTQGVVKTLMNTKVDEPKLSDLVHRATPVAKSPYRLAPLEMQELSEQLQELQDDCEELRSTYDTIRDMIILGWRSKVENAPAEMLRDLDQQMEKIADDGCTLWIKLYSKYEYEIRYHLGKSNVVIEAFSRKERVKPRHVRAMAMTIQYRVRGMILTAQSEVFKQENVLAEILHGLDQQMERKGDENNSKEWNSGDDQLRFRWMIYFVVLADAAESVSDAIRFEYCLASSSGWTKSPVLWAEIGESSLIGPELVQETTDKVVLIKEKLKAARDRQKSCADNRRKPVLEFDGRRTGYAKRFAWKWCNSLWEKGVIAAMHYPVVGIAKWLAVRYSWKVTMPHKSSKDYKNTRHYIPKISHEFRSPIKEKLRNLEERYIHEGRVVFDNFTDLNYVRSLFHFVEFECLLEINKQVYPRFILEFYIQYRLSYFNEGQMFVEFVFQSQYFYLSLEDFAQILRITWEGACVFSDQWSLDELVYGAPSEGPYQTNLPSPDDIISYVREDREGQVTRIRHQEEIEVQDYQILTREIVSTLKPLEEIIWENVFCLGGNRDHVPACLCYMLYCVANSERFNLSYFMEKQMGWVTKQARLILPYGMLLTRLLDFIISENPELKIESYVLYDRVINLLTAQLERKPRRDRGTIRGHHSTSSSSAFDQPSSSHLNDDDDDGNDEGTSRASTPSPIRYVNSLTNQVPQVFQNPSNIDQNMEPFYTRQTKILNSQVQLRDEHRGGVRSIGKSLRRLWRNMKK